MTSAAGELIDTHAHLHDHAFDEDREAALARGRAAGLAAVVTVGTDLAESAAAAALARAQDDVYAVVGLHPHHAAAWDEAARAAIAALAGGPEVVAIGEIGLDFYRNLSPAAAQRRAFAAQLALAAELDLPVVIHSRDAHAETSSTLAAWAAGRPRGAPLGVVHCFSGDAELALRYVAMGFVISIAGPVTYPKNEPLRDAARAAPDDWIVVETDSPYLAPQGRRGRRNEPAYVAETARCVAALRGVAPAAFAEQASATARRLFRLPAPVGTSG